jgi:hypothetical protein
VLTKRAQDERVYADLAPTARRSALGSWPPPPPRRPPGRDRSRLRQRPPQQAAEPGPLRHRPLATHQPRRPQPTGPRCWSAARASNAARSTCSAEALVLWRRAEQTSPAPGRAGPVTPWPARVPVAGASGWPARGWRWPRSCAAPAPNPSSPRTTSPVDAYQRVAQRPELGVLTLIRPVLRGRAGGALLPMARAHPVPAEAPHSPAHVDRSAPQRGTPPCRSG